MPDKYDRGDRPSPRESATLFMPGYRREGQDGNWYVIVTNVNGVKRWQKERYAEGGIANQYAGKTYKEVWDNWTFDQRENFLKDHKYDAYGEKVISNEDRAKSLRLSREIPFDELPHAVKILVSKHIEEGQYADGGETPSGFSAGDIFHGKRHHEEVFYTLITGEKMGGHYAYRSDAVGNAVIPEGSTGTIYIPNPDFAEYDKVAHKDLELVTKNGISFYKSGNPKLDVYMSLLEPNGRYKFFQENAPKNIRGKFDRLEDDNWHYESAELVNDFFNNPTWKHIKNHKLAAEEGMLLSGDSRQLKEMISGYKQALFFADSPEDGSWDDYTIYDFAKSTDIEIESMFRKYISENKDAISKSGLSDEQIGMDVWYTQKGHGVGFFDRRLDKDIEKQLTESAEALARFPEVEIGDDKKVHIRGISTGKMARGGTISSGSFWNKHIYITW